MVREIAAWDEDPKRGAARSAELWRGATESAAQLLEDAARLTPIDQAAAWSARLASAAPLP